MTDEIIPTIRKQRILKLASEGTREDGRKLDQFRPIEIKNNYVEVCEGSAMVRLGATTVIAGVSTDLGEPYPDIPNQGVMITGAELIPMADPSFEAGPPREDAVELARVVDRGIRESQALDVEKLCVTPGELVRLVFLDIHILDNDGNLFDACGIAAMTALATARMHDVDENGKKLETRSPLPIRKIAVPCTFAKIKDYLLLDPSLEEERSADSRLTISTEDNGNICAIQKGEIGGFRVEDVMRAAEISRVKGEEVRQMIKRCV
jgi:exosome complex component RRP42